jgi:DNA-binding transcriptional LysR family regulator
MRRGAEPGSIARRDCLLLTAQRGLIAAACQGAGVVLLPAAQCRDALADGALVCVLPEWSGSDGIVHLVFASRRGMLPAVRAVIDFAAEGLESSVAP